MADISVIVGLEVGDDYSNVSAALAAADISGGKYQIQVRNDQTHGQYKTPVVTDSATNYIELIAFPGDEVNGKGEGVTFFSTNKYAQPIYLQNDHDRVSGVRADLAAIGGAVVSNSTSLGYVEVSNCFMSSQGSALTTSNGYAGSLLVANSILLSGGGYAVNIGNITGYVEINGVIIVGGDRSLNVSKYGTGTGIFKNILAVNAITSNFPYNNQSLFTWDYLASSDATASAQLNVTVAFDNRVITDDLEDPNGVTPDYNLKATSTLKGAGDGGSDIGAYLGATTPVVSPELNIVGSTPSYSYAVPTATVDLTGDLVIVATTPTYSYNAVNAVVAFSGTITFSGDVILNSLQFSGHDIKAPVATFASISGDITFNKY